MAAAHTAVVAAAWSPLLVVLAVGRRHILRHRLTLVWLAAMLVAVVPGGRFFPNYFLMVLPPLALLVAPAITQLATAGRRAVVTLGVFVLAVSLAAAWKWDRVRPGMAHDDAAARAAARHVAARSSVADTLFVWGNSPEIYYYADRVMATRFAWANYHTGKIWGSRFADSVDDDGAEAHATRRARGLAASPHRPPRGAPALHRRCRRRPARALRPPPTPVVAAARRPPLGRLPPRGHGGRRTHLPAQRRPMAGRISE
jgi:4-amino-4-deoxy-L-arabinose transferase-like glycosyltransferase